MTPQLDPATLQGPSSPFSNRRAERAVQSFGMANRVAASSTATPSPAPPQSRHRELGDLSLGPGNSSRRPSAQVRINSILETAWKRADLQEANSDPHSPGRQPLLRPALSHVDATVDEGNSDGGLATSQPGRHTMNYQTTITNGANQQTPQTTLRKSTSQPVSSRDQAQASDGDVAARRSQTEAGGDGGENEKNWWQKALASVQSIELENKGSVARDHLALERTFLAWLRTSLAFASIGIAVTQLFRLNTGIPQDSARNTLRQLGKPLGTTFLAISILILFLGYNRYFESQKYVIKGKFPASRGTILLVTFISFALMVAALVVVIAVQPTSNS